MMRKLVLMLALGLICGSAMAEWIPIGESEKANFYFNPTSIRKVGNKVKMWVLYDYKTAQVVGSYTYLSTSTQFEFDCIEETSKNISILSYSSGMAKGEVLFSHDGNGKDSPIPPDSIGEDMMKVACHDYKM